MQSYDSEDKPVSTIVKVQSLEQILDELKKSDVEYVKVFIYKGEPSIKKDIHGEELLTDSLIEAEITVNQLHGKALRKSLRR